MYSAEGGARIGQMMTVFCNSENIEIETVAFLHNGFRVFPFHTVDQAYIFIYLATCSI